MSTITTINSSDLITNSRTDINTNFSNLNTDKIETSVIDTDNTLAANSDSKIPSQKAVKAYVDTGGNVNASETTKGIVEEATDAEVTAGTATGGTGAKLFVTPAKLATRVTNLGIASAVTSITPQPDFVSFSSSGFSTAGNTTAFVGRIKIEFPITAAKLSFTSGGTVNVSGTLKIAIFTEDGQTQKISFTTGTISANGLVSTTFSGVLLAAGIYYVVVVPVGTVDITSIRGWVVNSIGDTDLYGLSSEPVGSGTISVTASTMPSTITPTAITPAVTGALLFRLDN